MNIHIKKPDTTAPDNILVIKNPLSSDAHHLNNTSDIPQQTSQTNEPETFTELDKTDNAE